MKQTVEDAQKEYCRRNFPYSKHLHLTIGNAFEAGAEWQENQSEWISVTDAIPQKDAKGLCMVKRQDGSTSVMVMRHVHRWVHPYIKDNAVTHWKPKGGEG